ncbi:MAG: cyclic nucleotide-binding domain-containing protein [Chloroherpetonaceae bacterium]|nr:cyclic nucleotide-binding domain-containing protein [Chloroherpetonaceae bacterium]
MNELVGFLIGNVAFALIALSYLVRDIFWLRTMLIVSSLAGIFYCYVVPAEPLWVNIFWNGVFIVVNLVWIGILLKERRSVHFSEEEKELYSTIFRTFSPVEFMKLMHIGKWKEGNPNDILIVEQQPCDSMMLIYNGEAEVLSKGRRVAMLKDGAFVGEMSFLTGNLPSATVRLTTPTRYIAWSKDELRRLLNRNPLMWATLQGVLSTDLTKKLTVRNEEVATRP